ncbi:unnamed protein product [Boreogadus saida]
MSWVGEPSWEGSGGGLRPAELYWLSACQDQRWWESTCRLQRQPMRSYLHGKDVWLTDQNHYTKNQCRSAMQS